MDGVIMFTKFRSKKGITLIEIMTVVVIVGIVSAMAVPRFQNAFERMRFRSANRDLVSTLRLARSLSVSNKMNYGVMLDPQSKVLAIFLKADSSTNLKAYEVADSLIRVDTLSKSLSYISSDLSNNSLVFNPNGSCSFDGGGNIATMAYTEDMIGIYVTNVLASTGRVKSSGAYY